MTDQELAAPFSGALVKRAPAGKFGSYVAHSTITERLLSVVGPYSYEVTSLIRGWTDEVVINRGKPDERVYPAREAVVGCIARLEVEIDGRTVAISEVGDVEGAAAQSDGANAKEASSDALKRCAMRIGLGLHLWSQGDYFLDAQLAKAANAA